jgi:WD40 repeat protein
VAFSPLGNQIASIGIGDCVKLWDIETGEYRGVLQDSQKTYGDITYSPCGDLIACLKTNGETWLWNTRTDHVGVTMLPPIIRIPTPAGQIAWIDAKHLVGGHGDGSVKMWKVVMEDKKYCVRLHWRSTTGHFTVEGACVQDAQGLSHLNKQLLKQRGAVGEPADLLREAGKKVMNMVSVVNKLKISPVNQALDPSPSMTSKPEEELLQQWNR